MNSLTAVLVGALSLSNQYECYKNCKISDTGLRLIQVFEGYSPVVYKDSAGYDTIGIGHLIRKGEKFNEPMLPHQAYNLLRKDVKISEKGLNKHTNVKLKQHHVDALTSFIYNLGEGNYSKSTLLKKLNKKLYSQVPDEMLKWNKAGGRGIKGLTRRREAEAELFRG